MRKSSLLFFIGLLVTLPVQFAFLFSTAKREQGDVAGLKSVEYSVVNSASIGGTSRFTIYGYTSPFADVSLEGLEVSDRTIADRTGYFEFAGRVVPVKQREPCLSSKDQLGRISYPVCLPPFPVNYDTSIGPVLLPPTVSLNKPVFYTDSEVILSGQTIPESEVDLSVFIQDSGRLVSALSIIKPVEAFTFPRMTVRSDSKGNFSIALPSSHPETFRLFAQTGFKDFVSGHSTKLSYSIHPVWMSLIQIFVLLWELLKKRLIELTILSEILFLLYAFFRRQIFSLLFKNGRSIILRHTEAIMLRNPENIVKYDKKAIVPE